MYVQSIQHELHLWIYYMSKFLNTFAANFEFIIIINSRHLTTNPYNPNFFNFLN
jgi:hypothetical protein